MKKLLLIFALIPALANAIGWECINKNQFPPTCNTWRWEVPTGWLVSTDNQDHGASITFLPDELHQWKV